ncbi:MAG: hypothetical protein NTY29_04980 [Proteobacteria bacterium]|nr:hypothetical protein [Pseudomonadota bacterium]
MDRYTWLTNTCSGCRRSGAFFIVILLVGVHLFAGPVWSGTIVARDDFDFRLMVNDRFHTFNKFYDYSNNDFSSTRNYHITYINPYLSARLGPNMRAVLELETDLILDLDNRHVSEDTEVRNAYLQCMIPSVNWVSFTLGRQALRTIDGLLYDYNAPALKAYADIERGFDIPLKTQLFIAKVSDNSPYFHSQLTYNFSFLESITVAYDWLRENNDGMARIVNRLDIDRQFDFNSDGTIQWYSCSVEKFVSKFLLNATAMYERGHAHLRANGQKEKKLNTEGYLLYATADYSFSKKLLGTLFCYLSSGDRDPLKGTFTTFLAIDPYIDITSIFFNGGFDRQFSSRNLGLNGVQLNGVIAPGVTLYYRPTRRMSLKGVYAYLITHKGAGVMGNTYGWETDFMGSYDINEHWQLIAEVNVFTPGHYFKELTNGADHVSSEILAGITYNF